MIDCGADVKAFHDEKVTLPGSEQDRMRERRNSNRDRLKRNLEKDEKPAPYEHVSQGSYQMKTMLRDENNDYDIDDGAYFKKGILVGDRGAEMSSLDTRKMVRDAMDDGSFKTPPEVKANCVRIHYSTGFHVDIPVYRQTHSLETTSANEATAHAVLHGGEERVWGDAGVGKREENRDMDVDRQVAMKRGSWIHQGRRRRRSGARVRCGPGWSTRSCT